MNRRSLPMLRLAWPWFSWSWVLLTALALLCAAPVAARASTPPDVLIVGQVAEPKALDPHTVTTTNDFRILINLYDGLVRFKDGTLDVAPALATDWEISPDGKTYTFRLRQGVTFHDGAPFNAAAVKFNFDRMLRDEHPFHGTGPFPLSFFFSAVREVRVVDEHTVRFLLDAPYAPLLSNLAYPTGLLVSPGAVREHGTGYARRPSGTGAYRFAAWESNRKVVLERNDKWWGGEPGLRAIIFRPITDDNTRVSELLAGGIDLMVEVPPDALARLREDDRYRVHELAGPHLWFLILNLQAGPFTDKRVRQAANYAIDKQALVRHVLQDTATVAAGPVPAAFAWAHDDALAPYPHDPERARALLHEAGAVAAPLTLLVPEGGSGMLNPVAMATAIQADLNQVGFRVKIRTFEWNTYLSVVNQGLAGNGDMAAMAWMTNDPDTLPYLTLRREAWPEQGGFNSGYYANPRVDTLLEQARRATARSERARLYREVQRIVHEDAPWVFVANWKQNAVTTRRVQGFRLQPSFLLQLQHTRKP